MNYSIKKTGHLIICISLILTPNKEISASPFSFQKEEVKQFLLHKIIYPTKDSLIFTGKATLAVGTGCILLGLLDKTTSGHRLTRTIPGIKNLFIPLENREKNEELQLDTNTNRTKIQGLLKLYAEIKKDNKKNQSRSTKKLKAIHAAVFDLNTAFQQNPSYSKKEMLTLFLQPLNEIDILKKDTLAIASKQGEQVTQLEALQETTEQHEREIAYFEKQIAEWQKSDLAEARQIILGNFLKEPEYRHKRNNSV